MKQKKTDPSSILVAACLPTSLTHFCSSIHKCFPHSPSWWVCRRSKQRARKTSRSFDRLREFCWVTLWTWFQKYGIQIILTSTSLNDWDFSFFSRFALVYFLLAFLSKQTESWRVRSGQVSNRLCNSARGTKQIGHGNLPMTPRIRDIMHLQTLHVSNNDRWHSRLYTLFLVVRRQDRNDREHKALKFIPTLHPSTTFPLRSKTLEYSLEGLVPNRSFEIRKFLFSRPRGIIFDLKKINVS